MRRPNKTVMHGIIGNFLVFMLTMASVFAMTASVYADIPGYANPEIPGRTLPPRGAVPNPGTQQQEMFNITAPADWNVFEFVVTCGACHAGTNDQHTAHFGNWAGGSMASAARDPIFRANQIGVNNTVKAVGNILGAGDALDGAGNVCFRCHSLNGWLSGRFDPTLGGRPDGSSLINSILLSTDAEGIMCETCHKAVGSVTYKRPDVAINAGTGLLDKVWNLLAGIFDWEHAGKGFTDQAGDPTIKPGMPFGDTSLRFIEGLTEVGPYSGSTDVYFSDLPTSGSYTGQIYGIYPPGWPAAWKNQVPAGQPRFNSAGQEIAYNKDGTVAPIFEMPVGVPTDTSGIYDYQAQALAIEHPTVGSGGRAGALQGAGLLPKLPDGPGSTATSKTPSGNEFIRTSEFCGSCHDLTVPVLNHGMPEQRTFSEWKYSDFSKSTNVGYDPIKKQTWNGEQRCQDCHMPRLKHEYTDTDTGTYNADPWLVGGFPYGKDRAVNGGTAIHKLTGANRDLPDMMKALYPEVDLEAIGIPTGRDPRVFPGMLSDRGPMWDRAKHNTEITLRDAVEMKIIQAPVELAAQPGVYEMKVQVTNKTGHRLPTGYPDGRRIWLAVNVKDSGGGTVYESGVYDAAQAILNTATAVPFKRSISNFIDATVAGNNAVMVYERVTGVCTGTNGTAALGGIIFPDPAAGVPDKCTTSTALTNNFILFDNRIPPKGFTYADYRQSGIKFWNYDPVTMVPHEEGNPATPTVAQRYPDGQSYDVVTYRFTAAPGAILTAAVDLQWQSHTREFMEQLRTQDTSTVRPLGPPNPADPMYPATPNYLSNSINGKPLSFITALDGSPLNDNWGGVAYAAWLETGMGAPFRVARDDSAVTTVPAAPSNVTVAASGEIDSITMVPDIFSAIISWSAVADADGYEIWILYGKPDPANPTARTATADWDRLAVVDGNTTSMIERVLNPEKTYGFKVVAFNGKGSSADSNVASYTVGSALPRAASMLTATSAAPGSTPNSITLTWMDNATNEAFFEVWRFPTIVNGMPSGQAAIFNRIISQTAGPVDGQAITGTNTWVDTDPWLAPGTCYYYQVRSRSDGADVSTWTMPLVQGCTVTTGAAAINLSAAASGGYRADVTWTTNVTNEANYQVWRDTTLLATVTAKNYVDTTVVPATTYSYTVRAIAADGTTILAEATTSITMPAVPVTPTNVVAAATGTQITVNWTHNGANADGYSVERSSITNGVNSGYIPVPIAGIIIPPNAPTFADLGVTELTTYQYRVKAVRQVVGDSPYAVSNQITTGLFGPVNLQAAIDAGLPTPTNVHVTMNWIDVSQKETSYMVERKIGATGAWTVIAAALPADSRQLADLFPVNPTAFTVQYRVTAVAAALTSQAVTTSLNVPARPATGPRPTVNNATGTSLDVSFTLPAGSLGYQLQRRAGNGAWTNLGPTPGSGAISITDTPLANGTTYQYQVKVANPGGWSANWSNSGSGTTLAAPAAPARPTVANTGACDLTNSGACTQSVNITIATKASAGWEVQRCTGSTNGSGPCSANGSGWVLLQAGTATGKQIITSGSLLDNTTYRYRVNQSNAIGASNWSGVTSTQRN